MKTEWRCYSNTFTFFPLAHLHRETNSVFKQDILVRITWKKYLVYSYIYIEASLCYKSNQMVPTFLSLTAWRHVSQAKLTQAISGPKSRAKIIMHHVQSYCSLGSVFALHSFYGTSSQ